MESTRERIRRGELRGEALLAWIAAIDPSRRDAQMEKLFGLDAPVDASPPGEDLVGYIPSGVAPIVRAIFDAPVTKDDVFVDLGSGLGKVAMLVHLLTGARTHGVEIQPALVARARTSAERLGLDGVSFEEGDARTAHLDDGTVFFLYAPFTGPALVATLARLREVATKRDIVVCALGIDLRAPGWKPPRASDSFWLSIHDSGRAPRASVVMPGFAESIARERRAR